MLRNLFEAPRLIGRSILDWWDSWLDLLGVVLLWLVAQVTVVCGPPATIGLFYVCHALINGESIGVRGLVEGARKYFGKSWLLAFINLFVLLVLYANFSFYDRFQSSWGVYAQAFALVAWLVWLVVQFYAIPYLFEMEEKNLMSAIRNGFFTGMAAPLFSFTILAFALLIVAFCAFLWVPIFFGIPAIIPLMAVRALNNRLQAHGIRPREKSPLELEREENH